MQFEYYLILALHKVRKSEPSIIKTGPTVSKLAQMNWLGLPDE